MATIGSTKQWRGELSPIQATSNRSLRLWLFAMAGLVIAMVVVGGATRLTGSGLSITEWQPIMGTLPPLTEAAWLEAFHKYQQIPQYQAINKGMSLDAFKGIFWWEWSHRFLGRLLGVLFLVPFLVFLMRGRITAVLGWKLAALFVLGGLQGALGWYMVKSGLSQRTDVSQYRLAAHLLLASVLFSALLWTALDEGARMRHHIHLKTLARGSMATGAVIMLLVFLQIGAGALVAGMKAGLTYNTWPLMDGHLIPSGLGAMQPWWENAFENAATVQFDHRMLAYVLAAVTLWHTVRIILSADNASTRRSAVLLLFAIAFQIGLGIWTLLSQVPLHLALVHQATAMLVLGASVWHFHTLLND